MTSGLEVRRPQPEAVLDALDAALDGHGHPGDPVLRELAETAGTVAGALCPATRWHLRAALRQKESLLLLGLGLVEQALQAAHEAWTLVDGRLPGAMQALVLTQLASCLEARSDLRGAVRAARRAEALVTAECGESLPPVLAVRTQLVRLLRRAGRDATLPEARLARTVEGLRRAAGEGPRRERTERLLAWLAGVDSAPSWAALYQRRWRDVADEALVG